MTGKAFNSIQSMTAPSEDTFLGFLRRCEDTLLESPQDGLRMLAGPASLVDLPRSLEARALASYANAHRANGKLEDAERLFAQALRKASGVSRGCVLLRFAILQIDRKQLGLALEAANEAVLLLDGVNGEEVDYFAAVVTRGLVFLYLSRDGDLSAGEKAASDFKHVLNDCDHSISPRVHYAAVHNLGLALLEGAASSSVEIFRTVEKARKMLRQRRVRKRSVPDAKLRWVQALATIRFTGCGPYVERLLRSARSDLLALNAMVEFARISLDLGGLLLEDGRWGDLAAISAEVVHANRSQYSAEILAALLLWRHGILRRTVDRATRNLLYKTVVGVGQLID